MSATNSTVISALSTRITLAFFMSLLAFAIMLGNAMVILAFLVDKSLRHRSNYFFLNLAISDFFVGAISIPLYIPYRMFDWNFGNKTCVFWLIIDYLLCTTSVYNIVLISYDRYQSVSNAVYYRARHTGILKMVALMLSVWVLAFFVHGPAILFSQSWKIGENLFTRPRKTSAALRAASVARSRTRYRAARKEDVLRHPARKPALFGAPGLARGAHLAQHHLEASMTTGFSTGTAVPGLSQQGATGECVQRLQPGKSRDGKRKAMGAPTRPGSSSAHLCGCSPGPTSAWFHLINKLCFQGPIR
ncbi:Histamine H4 receptor [Manis javanica]|nr:Histamine H4 receptor [Manis javanica]